MRNRRSRVFLLCPPMPLRRVHTLLSWSSSPAHRVVSLSLPSSSLRKDVCLMRNYAGMCWQLHYSFSVSFGWMPCMLGAAWSSLVFFVLVFLTTLFRSFVVDTHQRWMQLRCEGAVQTYSRNIGPSTQFKGHSITTVMVSGTLA